MHDSIPFLHLSCLSFLSFSSFFPLETFSKAPEGSVEIDQIDVRSTRESAHRNELKVASDQPFTRASRLNQDKSRAEGLGDHEEYLRHFLRRDVICNFSRPCLDACRQSR